MGHFKCCPDHDHVNSPFDLCPPALPQSVTTCRSSWLTKSILIGFKVLSEMVQLQNFTVLLQEKEKMPKSFPGPVSYFSHSAFKVWMGFSVLSIPACLPSLFPSPPADHSGGILRSRGLHRAPRELDLYSIWRKIFCSKTQYTAHTFLTKCTKMKEGNTAGSSPVLGLLLCRRPVWGGPAQYSPTLTLLCLHSG